MAETAYIVLRRSVERSGKVEGSDSADSTGRTDSGWAWRIENSNVPATNAEAAIRLACKQDSNPAGTYVAIPARSWKPLTVTAEHAAHQEGKPMADLAPSPLTQSPAPTLTRRLGELKVEADRHVANLATTLRDIDKTRHQLHEHGITMTVDLGPIGNAAAIARRQVDEHKDRPVFTMPKAS